MVSYFFAVMAGAMGIFLMHLSLRLRRQQNLSLDEQEILTLQPEKFFVRFSSFPAMKKFQDDNENIDAHILYSQHLPSAVVYNVKGKEFDLLKRRVPKGTRFMSSTTFDLL